MRYTPEQQQAIDLLAAKHQQIAVGRSEIRARLERQIEHEMNLLYIEESQLANKALNLGVSKTRIGRSIGTSHWPSIQSVLELAKPAEVVAEQVWRPWEYDAAARTVTFHEWLDRVDLRNPKLRREDVTYRVVDDPYEPGKLAFEQEAYRVVHMRSLEPVIDELMGQHQAPAATTDAITSSFDELTKAYAMNPDAYEEEDE